jgi:uncharacterized protein (DUF1697 family)
MATLVEMCETAGFERVSTYIASGSVVFRSKRNERQVKAVLEARLASYAGKSVGVLVRTADEMDMILAGNPFRDVPANRTVAIFLDEAPPLDVLTTARGVTAERLALGAREIYVTYGERMATSKLTISVAKVGTARNMNTIAKLATMVGGLKLNEQFLSIGLANGNRGTKRPIPRRTDE